MTDIQLHLAKITDIPAVLELQEKYLFANLSDDEKKAGFVTTPFTVDQLKEVIAQEGLFLASHNNKIIAYCFAASWQYFSQWKIFEHMITLFPNYRFNSSEITIHNRFQYGPICIDIPFRGKGIINLLVAFMRCNMAKKYPIAVTFINKINVPSFKAHTEKLDWKVISEFAFNDNEYFVLAMDMKEV